MEKLNKLSLPATILIASIVLGGFYYFSQVNKQKSIERQQQIEQQATLEQDKRKYTADQKDACLGIYKAESDKWNNVNEWSYDELNDRCEITYKDPNKKTEAQCQKGLDDVKAIYKDEPVPPSSFISYLHCIDGTFTKTF